MSKVSKDHFSNKSLGLWLFFWLVGSTAIDWSLRYASIYNFGIGTIVAFTIFALVLGTSGPFPLWILLYSKFQDQKRIEATFLVFKIKNTFSEWSKNFDDDMEFQQSKGITPVFRGVSKNDPQKVIAILQAKSGVLERFLQLNNEKISASGQIVGTEEVSIFLPNG